MLDLASSGESCRHLKTWKIEAATDGSNQSTATYICVRAHVHGSLPSVQNKGEVTKHGRTMVKQRWRGAPRRHKNTNIARGGDLAVGSRTDQVVVCAGAAALSTAGVLVEQEDGEQYDAREDEHVERPDQVEVRLGRDAAPPADSAEPPHS